MLSCDPDDLAEVVRAFGLLTGPQQQLVKIYLLREIAGLSDKTPQELVTLSTCMDCIPAGLRPRVELYLLCASANAAGA
jgi:hypothetical protein